MPQARHFLFYFCVSVIRLASVAEQKKEQENDDDPPHVIFKQIAKALISTHKKNPPYTFSVRQGARTACRPFLAFLYHHMRFSVFGDGQCPSP